MGVKNFSSQGHMRMRHKGISIHEQTKLSYYLSRNNIRFFNPYGIFSLRLSPKDILEANNTDFAGLFNKR